MNIKIHSYDNQMTEDDLTSDPKEVRVSPRFPQRSSEEMEQEVSSETSKKMKMLTNKVLCKTVAVQIERSPIPTKESEDFKGCLNMEFEYPMMPEWRLIQDRKMKALIDAKWGRDCSGNDKMLKVNAKWQKSEEQRRQERCQEQQHISDVDSSGQDSNEELVTTCGDLKTHKKWSHFKECLKYRRNGRMYSPTCRLAVEDRSLLRQLDIDIMHLNLPSWMEELSTSLKRYIYFTFFDRLSIDDIDVRNEENKVRVQVVTSKGQDVMNVSIHTPDEDAQISHIPIEQPKIKVDFSKILKMDVPLKLDWPLGFPLRFPSTKKSLKQQYLEVIFGSNQPAFCKIRPNDRIQTFDGVQYKYKVGMCDHVLAKDSSPEESFLVLVRKEDVEQPDKTFQVFLDGKKIELTTTQKSQSEEWTNKEEQVHVFIDGRQVEVNPLKARQILKDEHDTNSPVLFSLSRFGDKVILMSQQHGLIVETDGHYVQVKVPSAYRGKLSGLCGNFDGEQDSEYEGPSQELYRSPSDFGLSYRIPSKDCQVNDKKGLSVMRNARITRLNEFNKKETCFSKVPIPQCPEGYTKTESEPRELEFHCVPTELESTKRLIEVHKTNPLEKMASKRTDRIAEVEAELECQQL
ncbi:vitellogenin-like [Branchiostoma lanceolatum]|uniref:vitellogenin-like n=1 Tax=Branchiostoma lanceolatum TaxID=7740 RepID=UPI003451E23C